GPAPFLTCAVAWPGPSWPRVTRSFRSCSRDEPDSRRGAARLRRGRRIYAMAPGRVDHAGPCPAARGWRPRRCRGDRVAHPRRRPSHTRRHVLGTPGAVRRGVLVRLRRGRGADPPRPGLGPRRRVARQGRHHRARVRAGDALAERALYDAHVDRVFRLAYRLAGDDDLARDFTQETFIRAFERLDSFRGEAALSTWLYTIATTVTLNGLRKLKRRGREIELDHAAEVAGGARHA